MKLGLTLLLCLVLASVFQTTVSADVSVGVKPGDWVEYNVTFTGNPPPEHDAKWARMEVGTVEGQRVIATFTSRLANGTMLNVVEDLDFDTGRFIDLFIIPAGLNTDDTFYDQAVGNITIDSVEARICAGATRTVVHAEALDTQWYWDRATGVVVEARTSNPVYTLDTVAYGTSLWNPQILGLDSNMFYVLVSIAAVLVILAAAILVFHRKRRRAKSGTVFHA